jgi:subtilisin family serine protease
MTALLQTGLFSVAERDGRAYASSTPNDPSFFSQWHLTTINALTAWITTTGSVQPIAVIDSGVDLAHPDLAGRVTAGWNFVLGNSNTEDDLGHGTATAGTLGAVTNNGTGVAGVTWNNPIMPLVVLDSTGWAAYSNIASAITYAADHGARIVNISIAGTSSSSTLQNAVNYAWNKGTVVFAAAGNSGSSTPMYPAGCTNVVSVAATDQSNALAGFSNYGPWIDLAAPGVSVLTTSFGGGYGYWSGTSFAAPIAAGVGGLVLAVKPSLSASGLVTLLEQNTDYIGSSSIFGYGLVDAAKRWALPRQERQRFQRSPSSPPLRALRFPASSTS